MSILWNSIRQAVVEDRYLVSMHAGEQCEERGITEWQVIAGAVDAEVVEERSSDKPNPSVVVRQPLSDGTEVEVVWAWLSRSRRALLVTVYFPSPPS
jgi:hypothetical protein